MATTAEVRRCTRIRSEPMRGRTVLERDSMSTTRNTRKESMHYLRGTDPGFTPPISVEGSDFKKMVSSIMLSIPFGATSTYAHIAAEVARRTGRTHMSAQAVGGAVGRNPIVLIVPCHRVLASDGSLRGYAGGVDRKEWLLKREGVNMPGLSTPPDADDGGERRE